MRWFPTFLALILMLGLVSAGPSSLLAGRIQKPRPGPRLTIPTGKTVTIIYGIHDTHENYAQLVKYLRLVVDNIRSQDPERELWYVAENVPHPSYLEKEGFGIRRWMRRDPLSLLQDPQCHETLRRLFDRTMNKHEAVYATMSESGNLAPGTLVLNPMNKGEMELLLHKGIRILPEPLSYDAWRDHLLSYFYAKKAFGALRKKDVNGYVTWRSESLKFKASSIRKRDERLSEVLAALHAQNPARAYVSIRGELHRFLRRCYTDKDLSYGEIYVETGAPEDRLLSARIIEAQLQGHVLNDEDLRALVLRSYVQDLLVAVRRATYGGSIYAATCFASRIMEGIDRDVSDMGSWLQAIVANAPSHQYNFEHLVLRLVQGQFVSPNDFIHLPAKGWLLFGRDGLTTSSSTARPLPESSL